MLLRQRTEKELEREGFKKGGKETIIVYSLCKTLGIYNKVKKKPTTLKVHSKG